MFSRSTHTSPGGRHRHPALSAGGVAALLALAAFLAPGIAHTDQSWALVEENFNYPDGVFVIGQNNPWKRQIGSTPLRVENQSLILGPGDGVESYVTRPFAQLGLQTEAPPAVEANFTLRLSAATPGGGLERGAIGTVLQFASADGKQRRGRLLFRTLLDGSYQLGVCTKSTNAVIWASQSFPADTDLTVRLVYDSVSGKTRVWINPDAGGYLGPPLAETTDADAVAPARVSLQANSTHGAHHLHLDDLLVQPFGEIK